MGSEAIRQILKTTNIEVFPKEFTVVSIEKTLWPKLLADQALSPDGGDPFVIFSDPHEVTLIFTRRDFERVRPGIGDSRFETGFRLLTFSAVMDFSVVGFFAEVSRILAEAGVSIIALSSFSRDHVLIKQEDLALALKALGPHVEALC